MPAGSEPLAPMATPAPEEAAAVEGRRFRDSGPGLLTSLCLHLAVLTALALTIERPVRHERVDALQASLEPGPMPTAAVDASMQVEASAVPLLIEGSGVLAASSRPELSLRAERPPEVELLTLGLDDLPEKQLIDAVGLAPLQLLSGRDEASRRRIALERGGTLESEAAVASGLAWLAAHQAPNGSWSFDHRHGPCQGRCGNAGELAAAPLGATALALLPMLGAGHTHVGGKYQSNVTAGLQFLIDNMRNGALMDGGNMYSHGIATIALCEALAMTQDRALAAPAQAAIGWIVAAQDPAGGGWRYAPRMPGDTSVTGWQLMALKSGHLAYLVIPPRTVEGGSHFLDTVADPSGAAYGYTAPGQGAGTTAVGLLCRMYLGWEHDRPALRRGVEHLAGLGPSPTNMYYNYYATQVLHHYDDAELWKSWNERMRQQLLAHQSTTGHEAGSFFFGEGHDVTTGGRLYMTAMSVMTLEIYYRYLPLYKRGAVLDSFALELGEPPAEADAAAKERPRRGPRRKP